MSKEIPFIDPANVEWVVNSNAELGVKIGDQFFWLYKGKSYVYTAIHDDDEPPIMWRRVGKREFGESCRPAKFYARWKSVPDRYTDELEFQAGLSAGNPDDWRWRPLKDTANGR